MPIYIGATGLQMMELTGEIADGAVLNYLVSPSYNVGALDALARGAAKVRADARRHRPPAAHRVLGRRRPPSAPSTAPASWSPSTWASSLTS